MHQANKQTILTSPENQVLHASFSEALQQSSALSDVEISAEFTSVQEKLKNVTKKAYR
ncbi:hypothetical protein [Paenibacillus eucommiae]|uniref:Uncharacterized protein n=1 Tax=Paenibacillus eucommiae TaxID=1355755 RepID=A0ABS4JA95_9BACL|nr:hypothetical protein [Paenibacillus eucommiae]MBP1996753.1 hypothetical protein [Paenibacillus eucommiae]